MATLSNTDLKAGVVFKDLGNIFTVLKYENMARGRGASIVRVRVRNLNTGAVLEKTYRNNETVQSAETHRKSVQYLYKDSMNAFFMDADSFEQLEMPLSTVEDNLKFIKEGEKVVMLYIEEKPVSIEIPKSVILTIQYTEPAVKGNTATNAMKKATLENGLIVDVPLFSKIGDVIKVNTETGTYSSRA